MPQVKLHKIKQNILPFFLDMLKFQENYSELVYHVWKLVIFPLASKMGYWLHMFVGEPLKTLHTPVNKKIQA